MVALLRLPEVEPLAPRGRDVRMAAVAVQVPLADVARAVAVVA